MELSKKFIISENIKCGLDPVYFLNTYGRIKHPIDGLIPLHLYDFQDNTIRQIKNNRFNIILKSRQLGLSTISAGYVWWLICFHKSKEVVVVANKQKTAQNFVAKVKRFADYTPVWLRPRFVTNNKGEIELSNSSRINAYATTSDSARSESTSLLVIDEAAAIRPNEAYDLWSAVKPTLSTGGAALVISTPKGVGNLFHNLWVEAEQKENGFNPIKLFWTMHPVYAKDLSYDENGEPTSPWYRTETKGMSARQIAQEYGCSFLGSGDNVIDEATMGKISKHIKAPIRIDGFDKNIWYWKLPNKDRKYLICADVARGDATDYSTAHVIDLVDNEQVAEYRGKIPPDMFAPLLIQIGEEYNNALIACEANAVGYATCLKLQELQYPNIFKSVPSHFNARNRRDLEDDFRKQDKMIPGFQTTTTTRPLLIAKLEEVLRNEELTVHSTRFYNELTTFVWINGKAQSMPGYNDDLCMAMGIGQLIKAISLKAYDNSVEIDKAILESYKYLRKTNDIQELNTSIPNTPSPYVIDVGNGQKEDLSWLF